MIIMALALVLGVVYQRREPEAVDEGGFEADLPVEERGAVENKTEKTPSPIQKTPEPAREPAVRPVRQEVPFTSQAPLAEWDDPRQQDGCEEASVMMAVAWARGEKLGSKEENRDKIVALSDWQNERFGPGHDTSAEDTAARIFGDYFNFDRVRVVDLTGSQDIIGEIMSGNLVVVPMNGQILGNPNYTAPGPERHMLVVTGYDPDGREFITNDPGTRRGEDYRYDEQVFFNAVRDYPTGDHAPIVGVEKRGIVVSR